MSFFKWLISIFRKEVLVAGSKPSPVDERDYVLSGSEVDKIEDKVIPSFTRWGYTPNQGRQESCVAFSINRLLQITMHNDALVESGFEDYTRRWSELYIWYHAKKKQGWEDKNTGVYMRDGLKSLFETGFIPYEYMKYEGNFLRAPQEKFTQVGTSFMTLFNKRKDYKYYKSYYSQMQTLVKKGIPVLIGCYTNTSMYNNRYVKDIPNNGYGHAMVIEGFREREGVTYARVMNWWGRGYLYIPLTYLKKNAYEYWVLENINKED